MGRQVWRIVGISWLLLLLAGCQGLPGGAPAGSSAGTPDNCTSAARRVVDQFIASFNRGDSAGLDQIVATSQFVWYSTDAPGQRINAEAYDRTSLMAYFAARHQQHERLALESFGSNGPADFEFRLTRSADDGLPPTSYWGKGAIQCLTIPRSLAVWSMARWPWSPIELLPEAAALVLGAIAVVAIVRWRRRRRQAARV